MNLFKITTLIIILITYMHLDWSKTIQHESILTETQDTITVKGDSGLTLLRLIKGQNPQFIVELYISDTHINSLSFDRNQIKAYRELYNEDKFEDSNYFGRFHDSEFFYDSGIDTFGSVGIPVYPNPYDGPEILYDEEGNIRQIGYFSFKPTSSTVVKTGIWSFFYKGRITRQVEYSNDSLIWYKNFN